MNAVVTDLIVVTEIVIEIVIEENEMVEIDGRGVTGPDLGNINEEQGLHVVEVDIESVVEKEVAVKEVPRK